MTWLVVVVWIAWVQCVELGGGFVVTIIPPGCTPTLSAPIYPDNNGHQQQPTPSNLSCLEDRLGTVGKAGLCVNWAGAQKEEARRQEGDANGLT